MTHPEVLEHYLAAIQQRDLPGLLALFAPGATVEHPVMGVLPVAEFYPKLLAATASDEASEPMVLVAPGTSALYFRDVWTTPDGHRFENPILLLFDFDDGGAVRRLRVLFDTWPMRRQLRLFD